MKEEIWWSNEYWKLTIILILKSISNGVKSILQSSNWKSLLIKLIKNYFSFLPCTWSILFPGTIEQVGNWLPFEDINLFIRFECKVYSNESIRDKQKKWIVNWSVSSLSMKSLSFINLIGCYSKLSNIV